MVDKVKFYTKVVFIIFKSKETAINLLVNNDLIQNLVVIEAFRCLHTSFGSLFHQKLENMKLYVSLKDVLKYII